MELQESPTYQQIWSPSNETKVCIIINNNTPIVTRIPVTLGQLTLGTFKRFTSLNDNSYKFYFKSHDSEFGTVKEELVDEESTLPVEDGRIVVWVISNNDPNQSPLFRSENPYDRLGDEMAIDDRPTFYNHSTNITSNLATSPEHVYDHMTAAHQPATISTNFYLNLQDTLGLTILLPDTEIFTEGLLIDKVQPGSVAARDGCIQPGDKIVKINYIDLRQIPASEAVTMFKQIVDNKGAISLILNREIRSNRVRDTCYPDYRYAATTNKVQPQFKVPDSGFDPATELPLPMLDPEVLFTPDRCHRRPKNDVNRGTYSLPRSLTPRSLYTTSNLDTLTSSNDLRLTLDSQSVYGPAAQSSLRQIGVALHCSKDSLRKIYDHLKSDAASLDIRDREWLKVIVKDAFLGSTLVKWLSRNVYGFCNRSETKRYANKMLSLGLIKSPMSSGTFSEKCYYVLT